MISFDEMLGERQLLHPSISDFPKPRASVIYFQLIMLECRCCAIFSVAIAPNWLHSDWEKSLLRLKLNFNKFSRSRLASAVLLYYIELNLFHRERQLQNRQKEEFQNRRKNAARRANDHCHSATYLWKKFDIPRQ